MIWAVLTITLGGAVIIGAVVGRRLLDARAWRQTLTALSLQFPRGLKAEQLSEWLALLGTLRVPVALELAATREQVAHYLLVPKNRLADVLAGTRTALPGVRLEAAPDYVARTPMRWQAAGELRITHLSHALSADRAEATAAALLGSLGQLGPGEVVRLQWLFTGTATPKPRGTNDPARHLVQAEKVKHGQPLLQAVGRVAVQAGSRRAGALLGRITGTLRLLDAPNVAVVRRRVRSGIVVRRLVVRALPLAAWPVVVNVNEAAGLIGVPLGTVIVPGLIVGRSRQLAPPASMPTRGGTVIAMSTYPGMTARPLILRPSDRLHHMYVLGPTGVGKSTLLAGMALGDVAGGYGLCLIDPKGDLVETVLARMPADQAERVIVLDPSATDRPVGFNPLAAPSADEHGRELAADQVLHIFRDLYRSYWGPRTDDVLRAALLTLVSVPASNGQAFTICEIPELLTRPVLRRYVAGRSELPDSLKTYWAWFDAMSEAEQLQHVGPVMNKLRAFTMRTATRLMLGQSTGIDLADVMRQRRVLLVTLAKGKLGTETATVAGSLLVAAFWQAVLGRVMVSPERRRPFFLYLDEFQDVVRLSDSLPELLSQARGLGVGAVLANQYLAQLPEAVRSAVLGTVRTQVAFQVEHDDARLLERRFAPGLAADDLMGLSRYEIAMRPSVDGQTVAPVTGVTLPLGAATADAAALAVASRERYGLARADVEAGLQARVEVGSDPLRRPGRSYQRRAT